MAQKWNLQDIRPNKPALQTVRPTPARRPTQDIQPKPRPQEESFDDSDLETVQVLDGNKLKRRRLLASIAITTVVIILGFGINIILGGAEITIYPKVRDISVQANFTAHTAPQVGNLSYELLTLEATGERNVTANGKEEVSERAQGKIFVYNTESDTPQRLIKNTRFESPNGLIFRIQESIEVPGVTTSDGKKIPGSIVADVFAEGTGEQYNLEPARFTVPGLKGTDQFNSVYAESTTVFSGGFEGEKYLIDEVELSTAKQSLDMELRDKLLKRLEEEKPAGFIVYPEAITFVYDELPSKEYGDSQATIKEKARLQVPMFKEAEFAMFLAKQSISDYKDESVMLLDPYTLTFSYTDSLQSQQDISALDSLSFTLKGTSVVTWQFDEEQVKNDLLGMKKSSTADVFKNYTSISNVKAELKPFWATEFPDNPDNIKILTVITEKEGE